SLQIRGKPHEDEREKRAHHKREHGDPEAKSGADGFIIVGIIARHRRADVKEHACLRLLTTNSEAAPRFRGSDCLRSVTSRASVGSANTDSAICSALLNLTDYLELSLVASSPG